MRQTADAKQASGVGRVGLAVAGVLGAMLGLAAGFWFGRTRSVEQTTTPHADPAPVAGRSVTPAAPESGVEHPSDELCFDRVSPASYEIGYGDVEASSLAIDAYVRFLAEQERMGKDARYRDVPYVVTKELVAGSLLFAVRPRSVSDDLTPALQAAAAIATHLEALGLPVERRSLCTVRVETADVPATLPRLKAAMRDLGIVAKQREEASNTYTFGFEILDARGAVVGLFFADLTTNEESLDIIYYDFASPLDFRAQERWIARLLSKASGMTAVVRSVWIDPTIVSFGGRSSGGPCGWPTAAPERK